MKLTLSQTVHLTSALCLAIATTQMPAQTTAPAAPRAQALLAAAASSPSVTIQPAPAAAMAIQAAASSNVLHVLVGQSVILHDVNPLRRIYVGNPGILQTFTSGPEEVIVTAKAAGVSTLVVWDTENQTTMYTVHADVDASGLRESLRQAFPDQAIVATGNDEHVTLTGTVTTPEIADGASKMAGLYVKDVVNSLRVVPVHGKQVQLRLTVAEVDRSKLEQFGINISKAFGSSVGSVTTGQYASTISAAAGAAGSTSTATAANPLDFFFYNFHHGIGVTVQDLESSNLLQILAEPTLTTMSGKTARFLSGGEFPIPVVEGGTAGSTAISIQFRQYGVKVDFTPVINADGTIKLSITPEVSTLDYANAVTVSGFTIPALATRRSETEIELRDGQSFVLSGLLNHTTTDAMQKIPGIADIPIIGQIFRSKSLNHGVSELMIMCTATVVDPLAKPAEGKGGPNFPVAPLDPKRFDKDVDKFEKQYPAAH